jgi:hypothetical protein
MQVTQRRRLPFGRGITLLAAVACALAVIALTGCLPDRAESNPQSNADQMSAKELAAAQKQAQADGATAGDGVMKYEEGAEDPLVGTWSFPDMWASYPSYQAGKGLGPPEWAPRKDPTRFTIVKQGQGYSMKTGAGGTSTVTFDGKRMTLEYSYPTNSARYSGVVNGDTIVGTQHIVISEQTKKASVESLQGDTSLVVGPDVYDGPWTATRVK